MAKMFHFQSVYLLSLVCRTCLSKFRSGCHGCLPMSKKRYLCTVCTLYVLVVWQEIKMTIIITASHYVSSYWFANAFTTRETDSLKIYYLISPSTVKSEKLFNAKNNLT